MHMSLISDRQPRVGCGAVIVEGDKLLLIRRRGEPESDHWGLPGGKVDWGERVEDAVVRETREELGIVLGPLVLMCVVDQIEVDQSEHWIAPVYLTHEFSGQPFLVEPHKHSDWGWFALDSLPTPLTVATQAAVRHLRPRE